MAKKPSERRSYKEESVELNLTPMMNLIGILIPVLLVSASFVEIAVLNVAAPSIGPASSDAAPKDPNEVPLNLTVTITEKGYTIQALGQDLAGPAPGGPTIPIVQKSVSCTRYRGTWPPPRARNRGGLKCEKEPMMMWVYDNEALRKKLVDLKNGHPDERRIIIAAEPEIEYETIVDVMDVSREVKESDGEIRTLFDEVVLSPGLS